jgi:hypothetical protein
MGNVVSMDGGRTIRKLLEGEAGRRKKEGLD